MEFECINFDAFKEAFPVIFRPVEGHDEFVTGTGEIFRSEGRFRELAVGSGWFTMLWELCATLEPLARQQQAAGEIPLKIVQIKEKFGGLRFYIHHGTDEAGALIDAAEARSFQICEACGEPGEVKGTAGWFATYCPKHHAQNLADRMLRYPEDFDHP